MGSGQRSTLHLSLNFRTRGVWKGPPWADSSFCLFRHWRWKCNPPKYSGMIFHDLSKMTDFRRHLILVDSKLLNFQALGSSVCFPGTWWLGLAKMMVQASFVQLSILVAMHRLGPRESEKAGWMQIRMNHQGQEWFQSSETGCSVAQKWLETHGLDQIYQHLNLRSVSCSFGGKAGKFSATSTTHLLNRSLWSTWLFGCLQWKTFRWDEVGLNDIT